MQLKLQPVALAIRFWRRFAVKALARQIGALRNEFRQVASVARPGTTAPKTLGAARKPLL